MINFFKKILYPLQTKDIKKLYLIFTLTVVTAFFELLGLGLIIPILNIFAGNNFLQYSQYFNFLLNMSKEEILNFFLILLLLVYFLKFFIIKSLIYMQNEFSHRLFTDISRNFFCSLRHLINIASDFLTVPCFSITDSIAVNILLTWLITFTIP